MIVQPNESSMAKRLSWQKGGTADRTMRMRTPPPAAKQRAQGGNAEVFLKVTRNGGLLAIAYGAEPGGVALPAGESGLAAISGFLLGRHRCGRQSRADDLVRARTTRTFGLLRKIAVAILGHLPKAAFLYLRDCSSRRIRGCYYVMCPHCEHPQILVWDPIAVGIPYNLATAQHPHQC